LFRKVHLQREEVEAAVVVEEAAQALAVGAPELAEPKFLNSEHRRARRRDSRRRGRVVAASGVVALPPNLRPISRHIAACCSI
jgi:hypothetical protein